MDRLTESSQSPQEPMVELQGLTKRFDEFTAVDKVSLSVSCGEILALLGPNGAGKTTTVRMLAGILPPTSGCAYVGGLSVVGSPRDVRRRVGLLTEHPGLYLRMRGDRYLDFFGRLMGLSSDMRRRRAHALLDQFGMVEASRRRIGTYSKGMRQKIALTRAMLHDPEVLLLDEPTSAMDPQSARQVRDAILGLRHERRAIIICTHNLAVAEALADRIAIIQRGRIIVRGTLNELRARLLGPPLMEVRFDDAVEGVREWLRGLVEVEDEGQGWIRYATSDPQRTNPLVLRALGERDVPVVTLSEVPRSLEDVYLSAVRTAGEEGAQVVDGKAVGTW